MNFGLIFFLFLPLLLYIAVDYWKGFRAGVIAAILGSFALIGFVYVTTGTVDTFTIGECSLILVMGVISLQMNNERYFKFQPTVLALCMVAIFAYFEMRGTPFLVRYIPHMERLFVAQEMTPEMKAFVENLHDPKVIATFAKLSFVMIFVFLGHGLIMAYAALRLSTSQWFLWRLAVYPALLIATMVVGALNA